MITFQKGAGDNDLIYPLTQYDVDNLEPCKIHSPLASSHHGIDDMIKGREFELLDEVERVRAELARNEFPRWLFVKYYPTQWGEFPADIPQPLADHNLSFDRPNMLADVVHMDSPTDMPRAVMRWLHREGFRPKQHRDNCIDFLEMIPETERKLAQAVERNLRKAFQIKWYYGVARPEELAGYNMTAYPEGCPNHPSFPAGHGAAASAVSVLIDRYELADEAVKVVRDTAYCWAMFRTLAGVHYAPDNVAGLMCGGLL